MAAEIITKEDLNEFRALLLQDIKALLEKKGDKNEQWLKGNQVRKLLNISSGTLQNLRINGTLKYSKIGTLIYYKHTDILRLLEGKDK